MERNFCILIAFCISLFGSEQFSFLAKFASKNHKIIYEEILISPLMMKVKEDYKLVCKIEDNKTKNESVYGFLIRNQNKLFDCFIGQNVQIYDKYISEEGLGESSTSITINPVRFAVDFKGEIANIYSFDER